MHYKEVATIFRVLYFQILGIIMCVGVSTVSYIIIFHTLGQLHSRVQNYGSEEEASQNAFNINRYKKSVSTALNQRDISRRQLVCSFADLYELRVESHSVLLEDSRGEGVCERNYQRNLLLLQK
ncbi:hypothetical protein pdam_00010904, partial [Pocillopora damicornis]